MPVLYIEKVEC